MSRKIIAVLFAFLSASSAFGANSANPEFGKDPTSNAFRSPDVSYGVENIDPFSGALSIVATDLVVPSNGGLEIAVHRIYNGGLAEMDRYPAGSSYSPMGMTWDTHFGRIQTTGTWCQPYPAPGSTYDYSSNPVLELPDGSRQLLSLNSDSSKPYWAITHQRWIARCPGGGVVDVYSPDGIKYTFKQPAINWSVLVCTKVEHPNGTTLTINYPAASGLVSSVVSSEGQTVTFGYETVSGNVLLRTVNLVSANFTDRRTWTYNYLTMTGSLAGVRQLQEVVRPDNEKFVYEYYPDIASGGGNQLKSVTTPLGGKVTYTYKLQNFKNRDKGHEQVVYPNTVVLKKYWVVDKKTTSGRSVVPGTWTYIYEPADATGETTDITKVQGPNDCTVYEHQSVLTGTDTLWRIGLLLSKATRSSCSGGDLRKESYQWSGMEVSTHKYWKPGYVEMDSKTFAPRLDQLTVELDGTSYNTYYSNFDAYGNPQTVSEVGQDSRTTYKTYFVNTSLWIINRLEDETILSVEPGKSYFIDRQYDSSNGNLTLETKAGVPTNYSWHTSGASRGEINTVTNANSKITTLSDYKRGTSRLITYPISGIVESRAVNDTGTVASITDPRGRTTSFGYDMMNAISDVYTPKATDYDISFRPWEFGGGVVVGTTPWLRSKFRNQYRETYEFNGFGNPVRITKQDSGPGGATLNNILTIDADGRVLHETLPFRTVSYDALGRVDRITHADGKFISTDYQANNKVVITNERGFKTTYKYRSYGDPSAKDLVQIDAESGDTPGNATLITTVIARNKIGQVNSVMQGGLTRYYRYDSRFYLEYEDDPELGTIHYVRDAIGNLTGRTVGSSLTTVYEPDALNRVKSVTYGGTSTSQVVFDYWPDSKIKSVSKGPTNWAYDYDENDNLQTETLTVESKTYNLVNNHNAMDALDRIDYPSGLSVSYAPNAFGQATQVSSGLGTHASGLAYYPNGQLKSYALGNGHIVNIGQNSRLFPTTLESKKSIDGGTVTAINRNHAYDEAGNLTSMTDYFEAANSRSLLTYDGVNRLRVANGPWGSGSFSYDARNNITNKTLGSQVLNYSYNGTSGRLDSIGGSALRTYTYDVYGNITSNAVGSPYGLFGFDEASNLVRIGPAGTPAINYTYDGNARMSIESWPDNSLKRYSVYNRTSQLMYEEDVINSNATDYIYLGSQLLAKRSRCTATTDTDGDGISNCNEWRNGMDPRNASDAASDADGDGATNAQEIAAGTNIYKSDTDADGISDGYEIKYNLGALVANGTADSDGDTLSNLYEFQHGTRADKADTDGDGIPDNLDPNPTFNPAAMIPVLQLLLE